ncbi:MAG: M3 family metallopeptidase [Rikenellaceae bacterium]
MSTLISCDGGGASRRRENPLMAEWDTPFGIAPLDRIVASDYIEAFDEAIAHYLGEVDSIVNNAAAPTFKNVIVALDGAGVRFAELRDLYEMGEAAQASDEYRRTSEVLLPRISAADDAVWMNEALFEKVRTIHRTCRSFRDADRRLTERIYNKFVRGGALLSAEQKGRLAEINAEESTLCMEYTHNLIAENESFILNLNSKQIGGIPINTRFAARAEAESRGLKDRWVFTLSPSSMIPFLTNSTDRDLREALYRAYNRRGANGNEHDNQQIIRRVARLRQERAAILGYDNHAEYVISDQMAKSVDSVYRLLNNVWSAALRKTRAEMKLLTTHFLKDHPGEELEAWDWWYYSQKVRNIQFGYTDESLGPYMTVDNVRNGAFVLANKLYGLSFRPVDVPFYDPLCRAYEVLDRDTRHLGVLYLDLFARSGKNQGAWCGNLRAQRYDGAERIDPIVAVVCNFAPASASQPSQLTMEQVETLFHEFGHALHFLLQDVPYRTLAQVEGDFVEFPSQVMENWAFHPDMLREYAFHYSSKKVLPDDIIKKIERSKEYNKGFETVSYLASALLDLDLHTLPIEECDSLDIALFEERALVTDRDLVSAVAPKYHLTNFPHIFTYDYSAGYYFYIWAEVLDQDCFEVFKQSGSVFSTDVARRLRSEILERGGSADGMTLYRNFKGDEPSAEAMMRAKGFK